jgi:hypothetical protein
MFCPDGGSALLPDGGLVVELPDGGIDVAYPDGGLIPPGDGGPDVDAGQGGMDAGPDGGMGSDAGVSDAGSTSHPDAGKSSDAGAGSNSDAGTPSNDAGLPGLTPGTSNFTYQGAVGCSLVPWGSLGFVALLGLASGVLRRKSKR